MSGVAAGVQEDSVFERRASTSATSAAAALIPDVGVEVDTDAIPEADAICFDSGLASPLVRRSPHAASNSPPPSPETPPNSQPATSTSAQSALPMTPSPLAASGTEPIFTKLSSPEDAPTPNPPLSGYHSTPWPNCDLPAEAHDTSAMPHSFPPQQHAGSRLPGVPSSTPDQEAGTNAGNPQASSSTAAAHRDLLMQLFSDNEDLSQPEEDASADGMLVEQSSPFLTAAKRSRAASSPPEPPVDVPRKRRRVTFAVKEAASPKLASHSSRAGLPPSRSKGKKAEADMEIDSDSSTGSEADDEVMGGDSDEEEEDAASKDPKGKGKARSEASSSHKMSTPGVKKAPNKRRPEVSNDRIPPFEKDIPAAYRPLQYPLEDDELLEFNWFAPTHPSAAKEKPSEKDPKAPVEGTRPPASQAPPARSWHSFVAPMMALDEDLDRVGEVTLLGGSFCFPFEAQVIYYFASLPMFLTFANNRWGPMKTSLFLMSSRQAFFVIIASIFSLNHHMVAWAPFSSHCAADG